MSVLDRIPTLTREELLDASTFTALLDLDSEVERVEKENELELRASILKTKTAFRNLLNAYKKELAIANRPTWGSMTFIYTDRGLVANKVENFLEILRKDELFKDKIFFNELSGVPEILQDGKKRRWNDTDDSTVRRIIEKRYGIYSEKKLQDALNIIYDEKRYNPVKEIIEQVEWDGKTRIHTLLNKWLKVENTPYTREVSRLIFAGGIHRLYNPGCKFDEMPVLVGVKQGEGKSTFVSWVALEERFFREVKEMEGQKGIEILQGAWICEVSELLALTKTKEQEAVKAYLTCKIDTYRRPFARHVIEQPRSCIFIGTTNKAQFLTDKTGNRRFYPVTVNSTGYELFKNKDEIQHDILQCWAEALHLYNKGELKPYADESLVDEYRKRQNEAMEDDYREGLIEEYIENKSIVCVLELWEKALGETYKPSRKDSADIALIMQKIGGWEKESKARRTKDHGVQKCWVKIEEQEELPF